MLDAIKSFFRRHGVDPGAEAGDVPDRAPEPVAVPVARSERPLHIAACALLLELAHSDREFAEEERRHIEETMVRHFGLPAESARELMAAAEEQRREHPDLHQFVHQVTASYDEDQRVALTEVLWRLVYADGTLSKHEDHLMQKLGRLLDLRPGDLAAARRRARGGG
jgi:uncharacterized tellurite resistance protein B-like protein